MYLSDDEMNLVRDQKFLLAKIRISEKIQSLLGDTRKSLSDVLGLDQLPFFNSSILSKGKISKGENYRGLPYQVLDFPALFAGEDIFTFRTMFWWGNCFSATLHLQGKPLDFHRQKFMDKCSLLEGQQIYIGTGASPWQYHFGTDNYELLTAGHEEFMATCPFLKLAKRVELDQWKDVPSISTAFLKFLLDVLR